MRLTSRRNFIRQCGFGTAALALAPLVEGGTLNAGREPMVSMANGRGMASVDSHVLWHIGANPSKNAQFALAPNGFTQFLEFFGRPDQVYYIGLSSAKVDWPYVLPGPLDHWAGCSGNGRWDMMNTLPIGFVISRASEVGKCVFTIKVRQAQPEHPPELRITINGEVFEHQLAGGGNAEAIKGDFHSAMPQVVRVQFPTALLKSGYNEIALRSTHGSWLIFGDLRLETPVGVELAMPSRTIIRSVRAAPYAVSADPKTPATLRVEVFRDGAPGKLAVRIGSGKAQPWMVESGLQILEIPVPASSMGRSTRVRIGVGGRTLCDMRLRLPPSPPATPADYVDVFIGTSHARWMFGPGPWMPFGMVKLSPDNQTQGWCAGYEYSHEYIDCFSHIHEWTMAGLGMMPTVGPLRRHPGLDGTGYSSRFDKSTERGGIGFYEVLLKDTGIRVELTATTRASLQRYTFPASNQARVLFPFLLANEYEMHVLGVNVRRSGPAEIEGIIQTDVPYIGYPGRQHFLLHFVVQFSRPFKELGGWQSEGGANVTIQRGLSSPAKESHGWPDGVTYDAQQLDLSGDCGVFVNFETTAGETIAVRAGISLVSIADARLNLEQEMAQPFGWDFQAVVKNQRRVWNDIFKRVQIETPDAREKTRFYTNLYRSLSGRNTWSDVSGKWKDPLMRPQKLDNPENVMLGSDALWTTFWNMNQVMNLIAPEWSVRWFRSELELYEKCGWLAKGPAGLKYIAVMVAEHEIPLMVAACQHGLKGLDAEKALQAVLHQQTSMPQYLPCGGAVGNADLENYLKYGYVAVDGPGGPGGNSQWTWPKTSNTFEYSYDDWCVAQLALALGRKNIAAEFLKRSQSWRNVFDAEVGFARARKINGDWLAPFSPSQARGGFVEGTAWQYSWFVPQDVPGLISAMGRDRFIRRLNEGFEKSVSARFNGNTPVNQGNEPTMQVSWLFNWAGVPYLSQKWTRAILEAYYGFHPADGYLGDEDQGQMSSWFVMSSLGLFEMDGGCRVNPVYEIGSPLYPKITLHLSREHYDGKTFVIEARNTSRTNRYIQSATLNGRPLKEWWIRWRDVVSGGKLELEMGPTANKNWANEGSPPGAET